MVSNTKSNGRTPDCTEHSENFNKSNEASCSSSQSSQNGVITSYMKGFFENARNILYFSNPSLCYGAALGMCSSVEEITHISFEKMSLQTEKYSDNHCDFARDTFGKHEIKDKSSMSYKKLHFENGLITKLALKHLFLNCKKIKHLEIKCCHKDLTSYLLHESQDFKVEKLSLHLTSFTIPPTLLLNEKISALEDYETKMSAAISEMSGENFKVFDAFKVANDLLCLSYKPNFFIRPVLDVLSHNKTRILLTRCEFNDVKLLSDEQRSNIYELVVVDSIFKQKDILAKMLPPLPVNNQVDRISQLKRLVMDHCQLCGTESLDDFCASVHAQQLKEIFYVSLKKNELTKIPSFIGELKKLKNIDLSGNNIKSIDILTEISSLEKIIFTNNSISNINLHEGWKALKQLRRLDLNGNPLNLDQKQILSAFTQLNNFNGFNFTQKKENKIEKPQTRDPHNRRKLKSFEKNAYVDIGRFSYTFFNVFNNQKVENYQIWRIKNLSASFFQVDGLKTPFETNLITALLNGSQWILSPNISSSSNVVMRSLVTHNNKKSIVIPWLDRDVNFNNRQVELELAIKCDHNEGQKLPSWWKEKEWVDQVLLPSEEIIQYLFDNYKLNPNIVEITDFCVSLVYKRHLLKTGIMNDVCEKNSTVPVEMKFNGANEAEIFPISNQTLLDISRAEIYFNGEKIKINTNYSHEDQAIQFANYLTENNIDSSDTIKILNLLQQQILTEILELLSAELNFELKVSEQSPDGTSWQWHTASHKLAKIGEGRKFVFKIVQESVPTTIPAANCDFSPSVAAPKTVDSILESRKGLSACKSLDLPKSKFKGKGALRDPVTETSDSIKIDVGSEIQNISSLKLFVSSSDAIFVVKEINGRTEYESRGYVDYSATINISTQRDSHRTEENFLDEGVYSFAIYLLNKPIPLDL